MTDRMHLQCVIARLVTLLFYELKASKHKTEIQSRVVATAGSAE